MAYEVQRGQVDGPETSPERGKCWVHWPLMAKRAEKWVGGHGRPPKRSRKKFRGSAKGKSESEMMTLPGNEKNTECYLCKEKGLDKPDWQQRKKKTSAAVTTKKEPLRRKVEEGSKICKAFCRKPCRSCVGPWVSQGTADDKAIQVTRAMGYFA